MVRIEKSLKEVAWTGLVTAFYCEYCHQKGFCPSEDPVRAELVDKLRAQLCRERINPYQVLDMEKVPIGQMVNVAARKKEFGRMLEQTLREHSARTVVNVGCGFDTQAYRLEKYGGRYLDIDLPEVIYWKRKYLPERSGYRMYGTRKVFEEGFFESLKKRCRGKAVFVAEGLFCYIPYRQVLAFVQGLYQSFPDAILLCDTFLFQENYRFTDAGSQFKLKHPQWGILYDRFPKICNRWMRLSGRERQKAQAEPVTQEERENFLSDIILTDVSVPKERKSASYWIGCYERLETDSEKKLLQLRRQRQAYVKSGQFYPAKALNQEILELELAAKKTEVSFYPSNLQVEHTDKCNGRCIMCSHFFTKNHGADYAGAKLREALRPALPYVGKITLQGMGEPFLHPDILDIINTYHSYGIQMTCSTNASVMTQELAEAIHRSFYDINISCDACTAATYESIRKGLSFSRFLENVRLLRSVGEGLRMQMAVVAMRQNMEELPGIVELAAKLGFQAVTVMDVTVQMLLENERDSLRHYPSAAAHFLEEAKRTAKRHGLDYAFPEYLLHLPKERSLKEELELMKGMEDKPEGFAESLYQRYESSGFFVPRVKATIGDFAVPSKYRCSGICRMAVERPFLDVHGNLFLCCANWMHALGNICGDGGFLKVWNGQVMQEIRRLFYEGRLPKYCVGCVFLRDEMLSGIKVLNPDKDFYRHNYDGQMQSLLKEVEKL